jgi:hypothetical protein
MRPIFQGSRGRFALLGIIVTVVAIEAVVFLVAIPALQPQGHEVAVEGVQIHWIEGTGASGQPWFGSAYVNLSGPTAGFPFTLPVGTAFNFTFPFSNFDSAPHTITSASAATPFSIASVSPALPVTVGAYEDDAALTFSVRAPSSSMTATVELLLVAS